MSDEIQSLTHWDFYSCDLNLPNDTTVDEVEDIPKVTCPDCSKKLAQVKARRESDKTFGNYSQ